MNDPYSVLGIARDATDEQIKAAFRKRAFETHPDRNPNDPNAEEKFKEINEAYQTLTDPGRRAQAQGAQGGPNFRGQHFSFDDIFRAWSAQTRQRNSDIHVTCTISLEEAFRGKDVTFMVNTPTGQRQVSANIPAGVQTGNQLRIQGAGENSLSQLPPGDLYIIVQVAPHNVYARMAAHLVMGVEVDVFMALLGAEIDVPTIEGSTVRLTIPAGTQPNDRLRLAGHGMPVMGHQGRGDLLVTVNLRIPTNLSDYQLELLRKAKANSPPPADQN